ncbi:hypothetical protein [Amnibacterium kyonggiense]|uniref:Uncharacterized protein n=1 Tax=Amnibacterium kyonggiense TaxID=595671 RepID=A0A4R7FTB8_9MICO|nr:hypothetical protein [Amnibacterium kyonggiense]TDS81038.1 hypothetical protein CLV52_1611 [Amnibacterium kyonggiense]
MRTTIVVVYVGMAVWLLFAAAVRIALQLRAGQDLDALPFIGGAIGLVALVLLLPAYEDRRRRERE